MQQEIQKIINNLFKMGQIHIDCLPFYNTASNVSILAFIAHTGFILLFLWLRIPLLVYFNLFSVILYGVCYLLIRKGFFFYSMAIGGTEIVLHAVLTLQLIGINSGFQYYMLIIIPFLFLCPLLGMGIKVAASFLLGGFFLGFRLFSSLHPPQYILSPNLLFYMDNMNILIVFLAIVIMTYSYSKTANTSAQKLRKTNSALSKLASTDPLTGLPNRRAMAQLLNTEISRFNRSNNTFVLILCDIDNFKIINDTYGHDCGDAILTQLSHLMLEHLRRQDIVSRWGGEEFLILLPESDLDAGKHVAEKLRNEISIKVFTYEHTSIQITMTFGISLYDHTEETKEVIKRADRALYEGKLRGKNRIAFF